MQTPPNEPPHSLSEADQAELNKLVSILELSSGTTTIFAVALESGPNHPAVEHLKFILSASEENFQFQNFFYSDNSLHNFLYSLDAVDQQVDGIRSPQPPFFREAIEDRGRKVVMAFGLDQLPTPRLVREMKQLNLGRESLFGRELVLIFWLNKVEFLDEFRHRAPDFWDWRGKVVQFEARPVFNPLFYPYLQWLIAENSYLKITGVMQVQRQVDIFLDQIYVSLQAEKQQQVTEISHRSQREFEAVTSQLGGKGRRSSSAHDDFELLDDFEPMMPDFLPDVTRTKTVTKKVDLAQAVRESQYSVILGAPGAGKTTLLKYLALHFAMAKRDGKETVFGGAAQEELGKSLLPILFRIADYAERLHEQPDLSLLDYLRQFYRQWETFFESEETSAPDLDSPQPREDSRRENPVKVPLLKGDLGGSSGLKTLHFQLLLEQMRHGNCLMLLDGLDEVFDQESRRRIVEQINQFVEEFSSNKFVITSRIAGYRDVKLSSRFAEFTIEDMGCEQAEQFLHRWCRAIERAQQPDASEEQCQRKGDGEAQAILEAIQANEGVQRLTANPLLLTILALIHRNGSRLPNRRVELYALAVKTLTEDWQLGKKLPDASKVVLKENEVVRLLAPLAYWMHEEKPSGLVTQAEVEEKLAEKWAQLNDDEPESESVRQAVEEFLRKVRETTGLFVERAPGVYGFMHLTFEEYFAARYIADNDQSDILEIIHSHLHEPRWNETILLALGYYGIHFNAQVDKLVKRLFSHLEAYKPAIHGGEIKVKNGSSQEAILIWSALPGESTNSSISSELRLKDLLFAGQVLAEIEVNSSIRRKLVQQLVLTLVLGTDFEDEINQQIVKRLRQIELYNQKGEVIAQLKQVANDSTLSEGVRIKAQSAILYVACGEPGKELVSCVTEIVNQLEPTLFCELQDLFAALAEEMTPVLEKTRQNQSCGQEHKTALTFITGMSYVRTDNYAKAIALLEEINEQQDRKLSAYTAWSLATCYQHQDEFDKAIDYYQECFEKLTSCIEPSAFLLFWRNRGVCLRLHAKYEQALDYFQRMLAIARECHKCEDESLALYHIGRVYKEWGKYEQAVNYYQQSRELYEQLGKEKNVANQWYWLADCYRDWGKYEQSVECQQQCLTIRQQLEEQSAVASAYYQLGHIYQAWGKYEQAVDYYQQSRDLYEQLGKEKDVANQWRNLADCYRDWGKYEQAIECQRQCLTIRQTLNDQSSIAVTYLQLGRIYQAWGKYEQAVDYHQQSRELYQQLGQDKDVATLWYNLADCYRDWGKYEQAMECQQQCLTIRQTLDDQSSIASAYRQLGRIYQARGKYEQAVDYYQQSRELYQQLGKEKDVANMWFFIAYCYQVWGKYEQAVKCELKDLGICQNLDDQPKIALAYFWVGSIYQAWSKYEQAVDYYQQSRELYQQLGKDKAVTNQWYWLADCYRNWGKYEQSIECQQQRLTVCQRLDEPIQIADVYYELGRTYQSWHKYEQALSSYQQSLKIYQQLGKDENIARIYRRIAHNQGLLAKDNPDKSVALDSFIQVEQNLRQAIQLNTAGDYKNNLAYDYIGLGLLWSERIRFLPSDDPSLPEKTNQFEEYCSTGLTYLTELGKTVNRADEALDIARAYLEVNTLENLDLAEEIAHESLQVFLEYNRRKLEASAYKLLGEIYRKRAQRNQPDAEKNAAQFLTESLQIYRELDLNEKATEVEQLLHPNADNS